MADHLGWAVVVAATSDLAIVDRRRIELVGADLPAAPVHHEGGPHELHRTGAPLSNDALAALVERVRTSAAATIERELEQLARDLDGSIASMSLRTWPPRFPTDIADLRRAPFESQADPVMYRQVLAAVAARRGWSVPHFDARTVEADARRLVATAEIDPLQHPREVIGAPWTKDHRMAFAATIVAHHAAAGPAS